MRFTFTCTLLQQNITKYFSQLTQFSRFHMKKLLKQNEILQVVSASALVREKFAELILSSVAKRKYTSHVFSCRQEVRNFFLVRRYLYLRVADFLIFLEDVFYNFHVLVTEIFYIYTGSMGVHGQRNVT